MEKAQPSRTGFGATGADVVRSFRRFGPPTIVIPAILVSAIAGVLMHNVLVKQFGAVFGSGISGIIAENYTSANLLEDEAGTQAFSRAVQRRISRDLLTAARLRDADGTVVYSPIQGEVGTLLPFDDDTQRAFDGTIVTRVTGDSSLVEGEDGALGLHISCPVYLNDSARPVGVIEILKPYSVVIGTMRPAVLSLIGTIMGGALLASVLLSALARRAQSALDESEVALLQLNDRLAGSLDELEAHQLATLQALNAAVDAKDSYTARHSMHVADYAAAICRGLGMEQDADLVEQAGLLHDIGKIGVSGTILGKPTKLDDGEFEIIKRHPAIGASIIEGLPFLKVVVPAVLHHHERWDGTGYPAGLTAEEIPIHARILAVADAFDAMTTTRPYQAARGFDAALDELRACSGTQFDAAIVEAFADIVERQGVARREPAA